MLTTILLNSMGASSHYDQAETESGNRLDIAAGGNDRQESNERERLHVESPFMRIQKTVAGGGT